MRNWLPIVATWTAIALIPAPAHALGTIRARADVTSQVYVDGSPVGQTPVDVTQLAPGAHEVRIVSPGTGEAKLFAINVPRRASVEKEFHATFGPPAQVLPQGASLEVTSNVPVNVSLDGQPLGVGPLVARPVAPGLHVVQVQDPVTGATRTRAVRIDEGFAQHARLGFTMPAPVVVVQPVIAPVVRHCAPTRTVIVPIPPRRVVWTRGPVVVTGAPVIGGRGHRHGRHHDRYW